MIISNIKSLKLSVLSITFLMVTQLSGFDQKSMKDTNKTLNSSQTTQTNNDKVIATVNGEPIYKSKLDKLVKKQLRKDSKYKSTGSNALGIKIAEKKVLNVLINNELLIQASKKEDSKDIDKKVDQELEKLAEKFGGIEKYKRYLPEEMTDSEFRAYLKKKLLVQDYLKKQGVIDPYIPEEKIKEFYNARKSNFRSEELVNVSQILLPIKPNDTQEKKDAVLKKAKEIRQMLIDGEDFAKLARKYSQSAEANATGGNLGMIKKGYMPKEFDKVAFSMKIGDISEPIKTKFGYHIITISDRQEAKTASYEKSKDFIKKFLQERETTKKMALLMKKLRKEAKIQILP